MVFDRGKTFGVHVRITEDHPLRRHERDPVADSVGDLPGQAVGIGGLSANVLAALGGCWWPIEVTPSWMQSLAKMLPTGWTMDAMHKLISFQAGAASAIPQTLALFAAACVVGWIAARRFRFA